MVGRQKNTNSPHDWYPAGTVIKSSNEAESNSKYMPLRSYDIEYDDRYSTTIHSDILNLCTIVEKGAIPPN